MDSTGLRSRRSGLTRRARSTLAVLAAAGSLLLLPATTSAIGSFDASDIVVTTSHVEFTIADLDRSNDGDNGGYDGAIMWAGIACFDTDTWVVVASPNDGSAQFNVGDLVSFTPMTTLDHPVLWDGTPHTDCVARVYSNGGLNDYSSTQRFSIPTAVPEPGTKDECKGGGWQHLFREDGTSFRNQGQCIRYVTTGG